MNENIITEEISQQNRPQKLVREEELHITKEILEDPTGNEPELNNLEEINEEINFSNLYSNLEDIYKDLNLRVDSEKWKIILDSKIMWDFSMQEKVRDVFIRFLLDHPYLPKNIIDMINASFKFDTIEIELHGYYRDDIVEALLDIIRNPCRLSFDYLSNLDNEYIDEYLKYRTFAYFKYKNQDLFKEYSTKAYEIYSEDFELIKMIGDNYLENKLNIEVALKYFRKAYELNPNDYDVIYKLGFCLYKKEDYYEALEYYKKILPIWPKDIKIIEPLALCYYYTEDYELSNEYFYRIQETYPKAKNVPKYIKSIDKLLKGSSNSQIPNLYLKEEKKIMKASIKMEKRRNHKRSPKVSMLMYLLKLMLILCVFGLYHNSNKSTDTSAKYQDNKKVQIVNDFYKLENYLNTKTPVRILYSNLITTQYCIAKELNSDNKNYTIMLKSKAQANNKNIDIIGNVDIIILNDFALPYINVPLQEISKERVANGVIEDRFMKN